MKARYIFLSFLSLFMVLLSSCGTNQEQDDGQVEDVDVMQENTISEEAMEENPTNILVVAGAYDNVGSLDIFLESAVIADITDTLNSAGPYTAFIPTSNAFEAMPGNTEQELIDNPDRLRQVLLNHIAIGEIRSANLYQGQQLETLGGNPLEITEQNDQLFVNGYSILDPDIEAENGLIHVINTVILPE
ncbi:MAG: fasciclin domain-containing protein [Candidatus Cyclobacteriaceae bacterium M3_2C_046]